MKAISLFACGGIGDLGLRHAGFDVLVANELLEERAEVFKFNYPNTQMITGDIWQKQQDILSQTKQVLNGKQLDLVFATPPCQGMSKNGRGKLLNAIRQGLKPETDERNLLIIPTLTIFLASDAHTLVLENVTEMENTYIPNPHQDGEMIGIIDFIKQSLGSEFSSSIRVVEFADYGVPQCRQRLISIFTKHKKLKKYLQIAGSLFSDKTHSKDGKQLLPLKTACYEFYWQRADGKKVSDKLIRELIGESIPPTGLENIFLHLAQILQNVELPAKPRLGQQELCFT